MLVTGRNMGVVIVSGVLPVLLLWSATRLCDVSTAEASPVGKKEISGSLSDAVAILAWRVLVYPPIAGYLSSCRRVFLAWRR